MKREFYTTNGLHSVITYGETYTITSMDACHMYSEDVVIADWDGRTWVRRQCFNNDRIINPVDKDGLHMFPMTPGLFQFRFEMLEFERDEQLYKICPDKPKYQALYDILDKDGELDVRISIIYGYGAHGYATRPYEVWWFGATVDPFGCLTKEDVEEFINGEYWKNPEMFEEYLNNED